MIESKRALAANAFLFLILLLAIVLIVPLLLPKPPTADAGYGNDGTLCHGHNQASCRPDPQPSHGQDCKPHGHAVGNDDHCPAPRPSPIPSSTPTDSPSADPSSDPAPTGSLIPPITSTPGLTPPPTDAATAQDDRIGSGWLAVLVLVVSAVCGALLTARRLPRR